MIVNKVVSLKLKIGISRSKKACEASVVGSVHLGIFWEFSKRRKYDTSQMWKSS